MNKQDFELLSLAAKAVGIRVISVQHGKINATRDGKKNFHWNSLNSNGDAMWLRNRLGALIFDDGNSVIVICDNTLLPRVEVQITYGRDIPSGYASHDSVDRATRLAITTAAAEIGKAMP